jgi:hypothetical protein
MRRDGGPPARLVARQIRCVRGVVWVGTAKRQYTLLKFIVICLLIALLILGVVIAINP